MSFIKSDSLLSNIKNVSIRIDMRAHDGSNIFKSIFSNVEEKQRSIKFESLFDLDSNLHSVQQGNSLIDKLTSNSVKEAQPPTHHFNWIVCKNGGMSEEEDNGDGGSEDGTQEKKEREQVGSPKSELPLLPSLHSPAVQSLQSKKIKNETKNIPKNYGKAIICYIQKYRHKVQLITQHFQIDYFSLLDDLKKKKKSINTIADLRNLWSKYKYAKCMRVITSVFLRKHALSYIFDSRICTYGSHIKYRQRLCEAVESPEEFKHIKDY